MSDSEIQNIYNSLRDSGDLKELYPNLTGIWKEDKKAFSLLYRENEECIEDIIEISDNDEEFYEY